MLSNNRLKYFSSLRNKKFREKYGKFLAEGEKIVLDILGFSQSHIKFDTLLANSEFLKQIYLKKSHPGIEGIKVVEISKKELERISSLSTPNKAILVCNKPEFVPDFKEISGGLSVFLEDIRDPGNLGTIIRTADWFGIRNIFCSCESVDAFNPKVIQSSMGAICRVKIFYMEINEVISGLKSFGEIKVFGTSLHGKNIYTESLTDKGLIILGNESRGISDKLIGKLDNMLTIPSFGDGSEVTESLNIASAAAIVFSEFKRKKGSDH